jgi:YbbR domain-containing protein
MAELRGARVQVDLVKDLLTPKGDRPPVSIPISPAMFKPSSEPYTVPAALIADQDIFKNNNVSVANVSPSQIRFKVDMLVTEDLDVQTPPQSAMPNLVSPAVIEPRKVQVTGPKSVLDIEKSRGDLRVMADFSKYPEMSQPGKHDLNVPLTMPFADRNVSISPSSVKVSVEVSKLESDYKFNSIPLAVTYPAGLERKYYADYDASLRFVTVIGPKDIITQMSQPNPPPDLLPKARIELSTKDIGDEHKVRVKYELPPGVRVSPTDENREVSVTLKPQTAPE